MTPVDLMKQPDKRKHALMCAAAAIFGLLIALVATHVSYGLAAWLAGAAVAVGYELLQKYRGDGEASIDDALAGMLGATPVAIVIILAEVLIG